MLFNKIEQCTSSISWAEDEWRRWVEAINPLIDPSILLLIRPAFRAWSLLSVSSVTTLSLSSFSVSEQSLSMLKETGGTIVSLFSFNTVSEVAIFFLKPFPLFFTCSPALVFAETTTSFSGDEFTSSFDREDKPNSSILVIDPNSRVFALSRS